MKSERAEKTLLVVLIGVFIIFLPCMGQTQIPQKINYQGYLTSAAGVPVNGTVAMVFSFYTVATGEESPIWSEPQNVTVNNGVYNVNLGDVTPIPLSLPFAIPYYLGVAVGTDPEMTPRIALTSVGYAFRANVANYVYGTGGNLQGSIHGPVMYISNANTMDGTALQANTASEYGEAILASASADGPATGVRGIANSSGDFENHGGDFKAYGGQGQGVRGYAGNDGELATNYGGYFQALGGGGTGVYGAASKSGDFLNYGGYFTSSGDRGVGVKGLAEGLTGKGVYGQASNTGDEAQNFGGYFRSFGRKGFGVYGIASALGDLVANTGGYFVATGGLGKGIHGTASNTGDVQNFGGYFEASGNRGVGAYGLNTGSLGAGVSGENQGTADGGVGVYGLASNTGDIINFGGYFVGQGARGYGIFARGAETGHAAGFQGKVLITSWSTNTPVIELGEGLDYAEGFNVSDKNMIKPGSVLVIDSDNPGKLRLSDQPFDSKVAGIVAGARGLGSGVRLGAGQYDYDVALAGRVYCYVDATEAGVEPGDLLTTSSTPGHAMKAADYIRAQGAILGKAMQKLGKGEKGQILVLVTLQ